MADFADIFQGHPVVVFDAPVQCIAERRAYMEHHQRAAQRDRVEINESRDAG